MDFISQQKVFFVATAGTEGRVNLSPKGMDSLRVLSPNKLSWLNLTGSGNETAAHILEKNRITLMFCSFEGKPLILRIYGKATVFHPRDEEWEEQLKLFPEFPGSRQIFRVDIESVQTSCGYGVPLFNYVEDRQSLVKWAGGMKPDKLKEYQTKNNTISIDGQPTGLSD